MSLSEQYRPSADALPATTKRVLASIPGGSAYEAVAERMQALEREKGWSCGHARLWFGGDHVFGSHADADGNIPWETVAEMASRSRHGREEPKVGKTYHCWCCCWLREVQRQQQQGSVIFCATSNIFEADWIELHSAASSELSDTDAKALQVPREEFRNGQPEGWGKDSLEVHFVAGRVSMNRKAPVQDASTNLPMGGGCRWERRVLDQQDFPVYVFPAP
ncbi:hypothetical protein AK812_SmicGene13517 [Symbiodinium microadriaticum]|uniref:Uncharacterized protein n=1 Tax=Symbiodinium microadriaticum TaxID=2951 RepID=A0A1Q9E7Z0_SYMMI|nr:hypothetical protein AK812_SmicGene13517 [Symbiodinium microadriaticum]